MKMTYVPQGVCSRLMEIEIENGIINKVIIQNGCSGNIQAVSALVKGMRVQDVIDSIGGIRCGARETSCPDQLAKALKIMLESEHEAKND